MRQRVRACSSPSCGTGRGGAGLHLEGGAAARQEREQRGANRPHVGRPPHLHTDTEHANIIIGFNSTCPERTTSGARNSSVPARPPASPSTLSDSRARLNSVSLHPQSEPWQVNLTACHL